MRVTALSGGTGGAKLLRGLAAHVSPADLTVIGNTGDDAEIWGLHVSPDLDSVTYALAGCLDPARGWGLSDETFRCLDAMGRLGGDTWFRLGDRDLATHLVRTRALRAGESLSAVTASIARAYEVTSRILPMSDEPVRTRLRTPGGWLGLQEYFVRERAKVEVLEVEYVGAATARPAPGVCDAVRDADVVVVCPSNPVTSVGPILAVPGIVAALRARRGPTVAVSPIIGGAAVSGPAGHLMRAQGLPVSPAGIAQLYQPWLSTILLDARDAALAQEVRRGGVTPVLTDILMPDAGAEITLARAVLASAAVDRDTGPDVAGGDATPHLSQPTHDTTRPPRPRYQ